MLLIGILGRPNKFDSEYITYSKAVTDVICKYNAVSLGIIPPKVDLGKDLINDEKDKIFKLINLCDGIILQGGTNYYPYDLDVINYINKLSIPLLGVCLGMQSMAVATGGKLGKINNHYDKEKKYVHNVTVINNSNLYQIINNNKIKVNSRHLEYVVEAGKYRVVGYSEDNIIEAIELSDKLFNIGIQWHPENMIDNDQVARDLFKAFFKACYIYRK
jgi:gamma-glutamyl-gamma-aminobutyrate hydrolase PuuD